LGSLPSTLRLYILICALVGTALAVIPPIAVPRAFADVPWLSALILMAMTVLAVRFPIVLRAHFELFVVAVPLTALVLLVPLPVLGLAVGLSSLVGYLLLRLQDPIEITFNVCQAIIHVFLAGCVFSLTRDASVLGPDVGGLGPVGAILLTAAVYVAGNYALVAGAAALQMGANFFRVWRTHLERDLPTEAVQLGMGVITAIVATVEPLVVPVLAVPVVLISISTRRASQLETDTHDALTRLVELLELRDAYTAGHSRRVAETSKVLALKLGFAPEEAAVVESAGEVHDIGKIIIDPAILHKVDRLSDEEFALIKQHPVFGASIVSRFASYGTGHQMVRHHHERWDGAGYPDNLRGEDIPIGARIIAVADSYDAMTSARSYRGAMPHDRAVAILREGSGVQWDPAVITAMLDYLGVGAAEGETFRWPQITTPPVVGSPSEATAATPGQATPV
jgi:hypothetical protein